MDKHSIKKLSYALILVGLGFIIELFVLPLWLFQKPWLCSFLLHVSASLLLGVGFIIYTKIGKKLELSAVFLFGLMLFIFFSCFGLLMGLLIIGLVRQGKRFKSGIYDDFEDYIERSGGNNTYGILYLRRLEKLRGDVGFDSYIDIIKGDNNSIKQRVIEKLSHNISAHSVKLLKMALSDLFPEVRLAAANALLKIEKTINNKIQTALYMTKQRAAAQDYTNLGDLYRMYADIGLMEKKTFDYYMLLASRAYQQSMDLDTNQVSVVKDYARILLSLGDYQNAQKVLDSSSRIWSEDKQILFLKAETYFCRKKFDAIAETLKGVSFEGLTFQQERAVKFWSSN